MWYSGPSTGFCTGLVATATINLLARAFVTPPAVWPGVVVPALPLTCARPVSQLPVAAPQDGCQRCWQNQHSWASSTEPSTWGGRALFAKATSSQQDSIASPAEEPEAKPKRPRGRPRKSAAPNPDPSGYRIEKLKANQMNDIVIVRDPETTGCIECYPTVFVIINGLRYMIGTPCDWVVSIGRPSEEGTLEPVDLNTPEMEDMFTTLQTELEMDEIYLFRTPVVLTLQGEFMEGEDEEESEDEEYDPDYQAAYEKARRARLKNDPRPDLPDYEIIEEGDGVDDEGPMEMEDDRPVTDIEIEDMELILSFWHEDVEYSLVRHLEPSLILAREDVPGDKALRYSLLSDEEQAQVGPIVERVLEEDYVRQQQQKEPQPTRPLQTKGDKGASGDT